MNTESSSQLTILPTGIHDRNVKNIEIPLPFHCILYAKNKSFHVSLNGESNVIDTNQLIFIKKSTPFSVLLSWEDDIDIVNDHLSLVLIPQEAVIKYFNKNSVIKSSVSGFILKPSFDYISIHHSIEKSSEVKLLKNIIENSNSNSEKSFSYTKVDEAKYILILSLIEYINPEAEGILLSNISLSVSDQVTNLVVNNYSKNWTSKELSYILNMSESTFKKKMYKETGSINNFITKIKMIEALRLLRHTTQPVNIVAFLLGYNSPSYFTNVFKKQFGIYPSTIRRL